MVDLTQVSSWVVGLTGLVVVLGGLAVASVNVIGNFKSAIAANEIKASADRAQQAEQTRRQIAAVTQDQNQRIDAISEKADSIVTQTNGLSQQLQDVAFVKGQDQQRETPSATNVTQSEANGASRES